MVNESSSISPTRRRSLRPTAFNTFNGHVLFGTTLTARQRELLVLRVASRRGADYEWAQHVVLGHDAGLSTDEIVRVELGPRSYDVVIGSDPGYSGSLTRHVFETLAFHAHLALHVRVLGGRDPHHLVEAQFKAFARAFRDAVAIDPRETGVPSTKGTL